MLNLTVTDAKMEHTFTVEIVYQPVQMVLMFLTTTMDQIVELALHNVKLVHHTMNVELVKMGTL